MRTIAACVAVLMTMAAGVDAGSPNRLIVRLYNSAGIPTRDLLAAREVAEPILRDTGVDVTFRQCGSLHLPGEAPDPCADRLQPFEVVVRVVDAPHFSLSLDPEVFGVAHVVKATNRGWLATLFADRVADAATRVGMDSGTILGRVLAHEVGHLLLGTTYHSETGVMRPEWTDQTLHSVDADEWRFSMLELATMQRVLSGEPR